MVCGGRIPAAAFYLPSASDTTHAVSRVFVCAIRSSVIRPAVPPSAFTSSALPGRWVWRNDECLLPGFRAVSINTYFVEIPGVCRAVLAWKLLFLQLF